MLVFGIFRLGKKRIAVVISSCQVDILTAPPKP